MIHSVTIISTKLEVLGVAESIYYAGSGRNRFLTAISQVEHYEQFLRMILLRYEESSAAFHAMFNNEGTAEFQQVTTLARYIQLETESFYTFAKVLLDCAALFIQEYFRPSSSNRSLSRGYKTKSSHHYLVDTFDNTSTALGLRVSAEFYPLLKDLKEAISDFRDKQVVHPGSLQVMRGIKFHTDGSQNPTLHKFNPRAQDGNVAATEVESIALRKLMALIERYFEAMFELIADNRAKSAFMREAAV